MHDIVLVSVMTGDTSVSKTGVGVLGRNGVSGGSRSSCELLQSAFFGIWKAVSESQSKGMALWIWE